MSALTASNAPKERRNSERRKEKSRDAARCRRSKESEIFAELSQQLPLVESVATQLDKASVMRLVIGYLRMQELLEPISRLAGEKVSPYDGFVLDALDGFLLVLSTDGEVLFLSENVCKHLGLNQVDLIGQSLYEVCHPCDHDELKGALQPENPVPKPRSFFVRLRSALGSRGRGVGVKSAASYKVMHCTGHTILRSTTVPSECRPDEERDDETEDAEEDVPRGERRDCRYLVCVARPVPHPANIEVPLDGRTFLSRHGPSMRFTHVDDRIRKFLGYPAEELLGKSVYAYFDARDVLALQKDFKTLFSKGQCETGQYRFLAKHGGYVWVLTQATLIYENSNASRPQCVVCVNYVLSGCINKHEILSEEQVSPPEVAATPVKEAAEPVAPKQQRAKQREREADSTGGASLPNGGGQPCLPVASSTLKIFAPRTADMNKGFLMFADDDSGITVLKEESEPEDLTHLAPQAGDDSIPLQDLPSDVLDDSFAIPDPYGEAKLIPDYALLPSEDCPALGSDRAGPMGHGDPFLSYRDDDPTSSPGSCGTSPSEGGSRSDSLLSDVPGLESPADQFSGLDLQTDGTTPLQEDEFDMRAPYISMSGDDFPLLSPPDSVMWGPQDSPRDSSGGSSLCDGPTFGDVPPARAAPLSDRSRNLKSSLAALLVAELPPRPREWNRGRGNPSSAARRSHGGASLQDHPPGRTLRNQGTVQRSNGRAATDDGGAGHQRCYSTTSLELKMQMPSPPDPPPKRGSCGGRGGVGSPKRMRVDVQGLRLQNKDSVLLNLLVNGEDASHGYLCQTLHYDKRAPPSPAGASSSPSLLLDEAFPSLQDITQLDAEVNAPIHQLLTGEDLLSALDQPVPALV